MHKKELRKQLALYLVTDRHCLQGKDFETAVTSALEAGVSCLQYREKQLDASEKILEAQKLKTLARSYDIPFIINDSVDLARTVDADGVHLGQSDMSVKAARALLGTGKIIGVTARTVEQAVKAADDGADYIGCGAAFKTETKQDTQVIGREGIEAICLAVNIPVVAIGGISHHNLAQLKETGISGVAVASAILGTACPKTVAALLRQGIDDMLNHQEGGGCE